MNNFHDLNVFFNFILNYTLIQLQYTHLRTLFWYTHHQQVLHTTLTLKHNIHSHIPFTTTTNHILNTIRTRVLQCANYYYSTTLNTQHLLFHTHNSEDDKELSREIQSSIRSNTTLQKNQTREITICDSFDHICALRTIQIRWEKIGRVWRESEHWGRILVVTFTHQHLHAIEVE